ncbi:MAG: ABC transporter permease [Gammaproteobacteria bacterium]|jgi:ABC-2 type transport system permease protein|nr:ABC transporter permease [Gammaproteobacteria bacterium]MBT4493690.1 ABC transporter permease [Gammaproteobacteria bacterium]MBT7371143.1 ABC transporter permease [Gammaproteobacteria bacterium]
MNRMFLIAQREYLENVRTKGFWIGILMMPLVLIMIALVPILVESTRSTQQYAVIDESGETLQAVDRAILRRDFGYLITNFAKGQEDHLPPFLATHFPELRALPDDLIENVIDIIFEGKVADDSYSKRLRHFFDLESVNIRKWWQNLTAEDKARFSRRMSTNDYVRISEENLDILNQMIRDGELFAYFVIGPNPVESNQGARYVSNNLTDRDLETWFRNQINLYVRDRKLTLSNIDDETAAWINEAFSFEGVKLDEDGSEEQVDETDIARQWAPVAFVYFLWVSILINTQMLITNTIEEKSNKLIEVLLSSVSPITLMGGKIVGIAATGLTLVFAWLLMALSFFVGLPLLIGIELPIDLSMVLADPSFLLSFLMYFLLGYLLYAALLVGLGSMCNNLKEAQNLILPVQLIQMVPILLMVPIGRDPNGTLAQTLSYIPPLTPFVMMNRAAGPPTTIEYVVTTLLLVISIVAAFWLAAKIFRVGILMTGKPPGFIEIAKLLRTPVVSQTPLR